MTNPRKAFEACLKMARGTPAEDIGKAISLLDLLPNAVAFWVEAHAGNRELAGENTKKVRKAVALLSEVLASMPKAMNYMVVGLGGRTITFKDVDDLIKAMRDHGIRHTGYETGPHLRPELRGQPTFDKLIGPMHGGGGKVRYETGEVYDILSR